MKRASPCKENGHKLVEYDNALTVHTPYYYVCQTCNKVFQYNERLAESRVVKRIHVPTEYEDVVGEPTKRLAALLDEVNP